MQVLLRLLPPLGLGPHATEQEVEELASSLDIPLDAAGRLHFHRTAYELVRKSCEIDLPAGAVRARLDRAYRRMFREVDQGVRADLAKTFSRVVSSALSVHRKRVEEEAGAAAGGGGGLSRVVSSALSVHRKQSKEGAEEGAVAAATGGGGGTK